MVSSFGTVTQAKRTRSDEESSKNPRRVGGSGSDPMNPQAFIDAVKTGQRSSQNFKAAWHQYCDAQGHMMYDPAKQSSDYITSFFDALGKAYMGPNASPVQGGGQGGFNRGGFRFDEASPGFRNGKGGGYNSNKTGAGDPSLQRVIDLVKQGQRNSQEWKNMWIDWCQDNGNGVHDPTRHSACFIIAFVLKFGLAEVVSAPWASNYLVSLGELAKPYMVSSIKKGQSMSEVWKEQWGLFADSKANGTRDPNRHDAGTLMEFFDTIALTQFKSEQWMVPYVTGAEPNY